MTTGGVLTPGQQLRMWTSRERQAVDFSAIKNADDPGRFATRGGHDEYNRTSISDGPWDLLGARDQLFTIVTDTVGAGRHHRRCCRPSTSPLRGADEPSCYANFLRALAGTAWERRTSWPISTSS